MVKVILLTAENSTSALYATEYLQKLGYNVMAVSGVITSYSLSVREFQENSMIHVVSSSNSGQEIIYIVKKFFEIQQIKTS